MKKRITFKITIENPVLYNKMIEIIKKAKNINENKKVAEGDIFMELLGNNGEKITFNTTEKYENMEWDLFPKNLYEISPFIFLNLLRLKNYSLEDYHCIRNCFYNNFPDIVDGYKYVKIFLDIEQNDRDERLLADDSRKVHKEIQYENGLITYSDISECKIEEFPTAAKHMNLKEKERKKYDEDLKAYISALEAFEIDTNYK